MKYGFFLVAAVCCFFASCQKSEEVQASNEGEAGNVSEKREISPWVSSESLASAQPPAGKSLFHPISSQTSGVDHVYRLDLNHPLKRLYSSAWACTGVWAGDVNGDQKVDLFFTSAAGNNLLYLNEGGWKFREVATAAGVTGGDGFAAGAALGDMDGDGDLDLYVCNYGAPNQLFINEGNDDADVPQFRECAEISQVGVADASVTASLCDYDRDGDLDLFVLTNRLYRAGGLPKESITETVEGQLRVKSGYELYYGITPLNGADTVVTVGRKNLLFRNDGERQGGGIKFTDVSEAAGFTEKGYGLSATWWDYDNDGWQDLYIANDFRYPDRLMRNLGNGKFQDMGKDVLPATPYFSMGSAAGDMNNDGYEDFIALDMAATTHYKAKTSMGSLSNTDRHVLDHSVPRQNMRNFLYLNSGMGLMRESAFQSHLSSSDWSWTPLVEDFDGDGHKDLIITNGMVRDFTNADYFKKFREENNIGAEVNLMTGRTEWDLFENGKLSKEQNLAYRNKGKAGFEDVSKSWGLARDSVSFGAAWADFDGDGDMDVVMTNLNETPSLYRNDSVSNRVVVQLHDPESKNKHALGAKVTIQTAAGMQTRVIHPANGFLNANEAVASFGLGSEKRIQVLAVEWPGGEKSYQIVENLQAGYRYTITRNPKALVKPPKPPSMALFAERSSPFGDLRHHEEFHDDFVQQNLLPWRVSSHGPGHAWGDVDGDGRQDFCVSNGAGSVDFVFLTNAAKTGRTHQTFSTHEEGETNAVLLFDADGDGDLDLYFARGSYEFAAHAPMQQDFLYLNDGSGHFVTVPEGALPANFDVSGHLAACDYDRDGDLDLLVAGKVIPGDYPLAPQSRLLRNDSSNGVVRFTDVAGEVFPKSMTEIPPMVNAAVWSDVDADGWLDLMLAVENGPVHWLRNEQGVFKDMTQVAGLAAYSGWWNSICAADIDQDGDMDYIAGNLGLNTKYKISAKKPALLYYGDFDGSGKRHIVEAKAQKERDKPLPVRGRF